MLEKNFYDTVHVVDRSIANKSTHLPTIPKLHQPRLSALQSCASLNHVGSLFAELSQDLVSPAMKSSEQQTIASCDFKQQAQATNWNTNPAISGMTCLERTLPRVFAIKGNRRQTAKNRASHSSHGSNNARQHYGVFTWWFPSATWNAKIFRQQTVSPSANKSLHSLNNKQTSLGKFY